MAKLKQRQLAANPSKSNSTPSGPETEMPGEVDWVIVKKQIVNILVPPLPVNKQCTAPNPGPSESQPRPGKIINPEPECPTDACLLMNSVDERVKPLSLARSKGIPTSRRSPRPIDTFAKLPRMDVRMGSENPVDNFRYCNLLGVHISSGIRKRPLNFLGGVTFLNRRMRASNLERKLRRAGGLSRWLALLGLDQFVKIFQGRSVSKFQLVNLTMKKLKDMGADAVGPRRKLMHAIDCLCQPYCFEAL